MIEKERLKELIGQNKPIFRIENSKIINFKYNNFIKYYGKQYIFNKNVLITLFETKEDAQQYIKNASELEKRDKEFNKVYSRFHSLLSHLDIETFGDYEKGYNAAVKEIERLKEIEARAIIPKFKIGQRVWVIFYTAKKTESFPIRKIMYDITSPKEIHICYEIGCEMVHLLFTDTVNENRIFATKEEAEEALKKMKGE